MKKINTLLNLDEKELSELEVRINKILDPLEYGIFKGEYKEKMLEKLYQILSSVKDIEFSLKMLQMLDKLAVTGLSMDLLCDTLITTHFINMSKGLKKEMNELFN